MGGELSDRQFDLQKRKVFFLLSSYQNQYDHEDTGSPGSYTVAHGTLNYCSFSIFRVWAPFLDCWTM